MAGRQWNVTDSKVFVQQTCLLRFTLLFFFTVCLILSSAGTFSADDQSHHPGNARMDEAEAFQFSQSVLGNTVGDHPFIDSEGQQITLKQFFGKPLLISLIYTSCYHTCPTLTNHLASVVKIAKEALGEESFTVISIGFDTAVDNPDRMRNFANERKIDMPGWKFLSTDQQTIDRFSQEVGFIYFPSPKGFDHLAQTTILDAEGRVYRQIYGENFEPPLIVEPLKELVFGNQSEQDLVDGWINNIRLFCTIYDPTTGRYHFDYSIFIAVGIGVLLLGATAFYVVRAWRENNLDGSV